MCTVFEFCHFCLTLEKFKVLFVKCRTNIGVAVIAGNELLGLQALTTRRVVAELH